MTLNSRRRHKPDCIALSRVRLLLEKTCWVSSALDEAPAGDVDLRNGFIVTSDDGGVLWVKVRFSIQDSTRSEVPMIRVFSAPVTRRDKNEGFRPQLCAEWSPNETMEGEPRSPCMRSVLGSN